MVAEGVAQSRANMACGLTASANAFYYMSQYVSGKANLYTKSNITKASFSAYQKELYDLSFTPDLGIGIPWLTALNTNAQVWATSRNVSLAGNMSSSGWTYSQYLTHVVQGLRQERPVLLLTWGSPIEDLEDHWVTITRIYNDGNGTKIVTSNWHNKEIYDFDLWCASSSGNKGTLYFE
ncbi:MAG: hypothetical protein IJN37_08145 [Clostridia bacterium]|nr:hypothetical protein [Clostridia bacterium]